MLQQLAGKYLMGYRTGGLQQAAACRWLAAHPLTRAYSSSRHGSQQKHSIAHPLAPAGSVPLIADIGGKLLQAPAPPAAPTVAVATLTWQAVGGVAAHPGAEVSAGHARTKVKVWHQRWCGGGDARWQLQWRCPCGGGVVQACRIRSHLWQTHLMRSEVTTGQLHLREAPA